MNTEDRFQDCAYCEGAHAESDCPDNPDKLARRSKTLNLTEKELITIVRELRMFRNKHFVWVRAVQMTSRERELEADLTRTVKRYRGQLYCLRKYTKTAYCTKHQLNHGQRYPSCRIKPPAQT